ncbi:hypothetical protein FVR03_00340 [Pontibacter qinzhouensis]|uniref:Prolyl-tRNA synthetase n=1 Tax=Pontibacter qinzhouensis TaxID=2603253 RepID=A0A5C8KDP7_9BACT|nr:hypothetical protein [Pontibacter qinzhouensis]TXK52857.1 hypothetical protein FVR03_00340 [Pontibacter qinzhouensis]
MKKINLLAIAPALCLLVVSCNSPMALQTSEYDDMYYSSSDRTEYAAAAPEATMEDFRSGSNAEAGDEYVADGTEEYYADEYYDGRTYNEGRNLNHSFIDPYWGAAVHPGFGSFNRFGSAFYDPFFDPFYSPYRPYSRFSMNIGFGMGMGMGMGRFYNPYMDPFMMGGMGMWGNPYMMGWGNPYMGMGGFGAYNSFYNGYYSGFNRGLYAGGGYFFDAPGQTRRVQYGPRIDRSTTGAQPARPSGASGRPDRQSLSNEQRAVTPGGANTVNPGRPARPSRGNEAISGQQEQGVKQTLPSTPQVPATQPDRPQRTTRETAPARQRVQPQQREQNIQRSTPSYERSTPSRTYERSSSPMQSSPASRPAPSRGGGGGGRPIR